jgi:hypothetical protein
MDTSQESLDLWWVFGFVGGPVFLSGSGGTILRYDANSHSPSKFTRMTTPGTGAVFGLWGSAEDDLWACGGQFGGGGGGFVWHYDGEAWTALEGVPFDKILLKVGGRGKNDVSFTGEVGLVLTWDGSALKRMDIETDASIFSVSGNEDGWVAVGGEPFRGAIYEGDGAGWKSAAPVARDALRGVALSGESAYAVGNGGLVMARGADGWQEQDTDGVGGDLHAVWIDPDGGVWAVGGSFDTLPLTDGVLIHQGAPVQGL